MKLSNDLKKLSYSQFITKGKGYDIKPTYLISKDYAYQIIDMQMINNQIKWVLRKYNRQTKEPLELVAIMDNDLERKILSKEISILVYESDR
jgi:hypothetical protein